MRKWGLPALSGWILWLNASFLAGQTAPVTGLHQNAPRVMALTNASLVIEPGQILDKATLIVRGHYIEAAGREIPIPPDAVIRDMAGKTIYPGFIDLCSSLGISGSSLPEKNHAARAQSPPSPAGHWNDAVKPERSAADLMVPDQEQASRMRKWGFTTVLVHPPEAVFRGRAALVMVNDQITPGCIIEPDAAQIMGFTTGRPSSFGGEYPISLQGVIALIRQTWMDAGWYDTAWRCYRKSPLNQEIPETNQGLEALKPCLDGLKPVIAVTRDELDLLRASSIAREFNLTMWIAGSGCEYRRIRAVYETGMNVILPLTFPEPPDVSTVEIENNISLRTLRHWNAAPDNPGHVAAAGIPMALTSAGLKKEADFLEKLRIAVHRGLSPDDALRALTQTPARWLDREDILGTLKTGCLASFIITDGSLFEEKTRILETWVAGTPYRHYDQTEMDIPGSWRVHLPEDTIRLNIGDISHEHRATIESGGKQFNVKSISLENNLISVCFPGDSIGIPGWIRMTGFLDNQALTGQGMLTDGSSFLWSAERCAAADEKPDDRRPVPLQNAACPVLYPDGAYGMAHRPDRPDMLYLYNATVWTSGPAGIIEGGQLLVRQGKIVAVGKNITPPAGAVYLDCQGKHITPGIIDAHSHIAISGGINEASHAVVPEVRIRDVLDCDDINIYRQLAGGVTTSCTLHGSANPIGGTYAVIKLRWGELPDDMLITDATEGMKFALGENVKQSNWDLPEKRYPQTRMGVTEIIRDAFHAALDYRREWELYSEKSRKNKYLIPPRKHLGYEALLKVLDNKTIIHCHAYRQDEILAFMRLAEAFDVTLDVFIHVLEGYKVAREMHDHGAMATTFSDWWAFKMEAYDAIPHNGALMHQQGVVVSFNSDSPDLARRLNTEAAKAVRFGGVSPEDAFKFITLNAAVQLHLENRIGSLEPGKDADFVIWSGPPLSSFTLCEQTWIEGRKYFDLKADRDLREAARSQRAQLVQKILGLNKSRGNMTGMNQSGHTKCR